MLGSLNQCCVSPLICRAIVARVGDLHEASFIDATTATTGDNSKEPVCPRVELLLKIIIILLIIFLGFIKSKPC